MKNLAFVAFSAILPALSSAHYLFPHLYLNGVKTREYVYTREHDNGFQPSWDDGRFLSSNDIRCNKGSENHRTKTQAAKVVAGKDVIGFGTNLDARIEHPGPLTVSDMLPRDVASPWACDCVAC